MGYIQKNKTKLKKIVTTAITKSRLSGLPLPANPIVLLDTNKHLVLLLSVTTHQNAHLRSAGLKADVSGGREGVIYICIAVS